MHGETIKILSFLCSYLNAGNLSSFVCRLGRLLTQADDQIRYICPTAATQLKIDDNWPEYMEH